LPRIQTLNASQRVSKRDTTGNRTHSNGHPVAEKKRLSPSVEKRYIASHIAVYIVFVFYLNEKQSVKSVTLFVQNSIGTGLSYFTGMTL
jgi:hypothetical protein